MLETLGNVFKLSPLSWFEIKKVNCKFDVTIHVYFYTESCSL